MIKKSIAYTLMLIGFIWITGVCLDLFSARHHTLWIWHSQNLAKESLVPRDDAVGQMRKLELAIQAVYQPLVIPAFLMLVGGVMNGLGRRRTSQNQAVEATS